MAPFLESSIMQKYPPCPSGVILYQGPSRLDGRPIVVIATGIKRRSKNKKTGDLIQTWILREDVSPITAVKHNLDVSVCGTTQCPHRGKFGKGRSRYVNLRSAQTVWKAFVRGSYPRYSEVLHSRHLADRGIRIGSYGDPISVPVGVWARIDRVTKFHTGYTHQWAADSSAAAYAPYCMASVESLELQAKAVNEGWRTFRATLNENDLGENEKVCLNSTHNLTCAQCKGCSGANSSRPSYVIQLHGNKIVKANGERNLAIVGQN